MHVHLQNVFSLFALDFELALGVRVNAWPVATGDLSSVTLSALNSMTARKTASCLKKHDVKAKFVNLININILDDFQKTGNKSEQVSKNSPVIEFVHPLNIK